MKNIIILLTIFSVLIFSNNNKQTEKTTKQNLTISIIIPCYYGHFKYLNELILDICKQTVLPNEVVISLSETDRLDQTEIERLRNMDLPFSLILIENKQKLYAGENRNIAAANSIGDIIICQDADDKMHLQRIEIIKSQFEKYNIDHLIHGFSKKKNDIDFKFNGNPKNFKKKFNLTNGNVAFKKKVFEKIKWNSLPKGEDCEFNNEVKKSGFKCAKLFLPLLLYRKNLSSSHDNK
jgi:hypothetical protein